MGDEVAQKPSYILSSVVQAHTSDVKCLQVSSTGTIFTGSRDDSAKIWTKRRGEYLQSAVYQQPKGRTVNSMAYYENEQGWRLFIGRKDGMIICYGAGSAEPLGGIQAHKENVCCLHVDPKNAVLISGSWDCTAIIWPADTFTDPEFDALQLIGHGLSIWDVSSLPDRSNWYLSASADKTIILWERDQVKVIFRGHTDVVRSLVALTSTTFLSAANDSTIRYWSTTSSTALRVFTSQTENYIYALRPIGQFLVSCGEGGCFEIWSKHMNDNGFNLELEQLIRTPVESLWDVAEISEQDLVICGSKGQFFVYSLDPSRAAPPAILQAFDAELATKMEQDMIRLQEQMSEEVVIKVNVDDSGQSLTLKYKKGTDPRLTAESFVQQHNLLPSHVNEVYEYILNSVPEARDFVTKKHRPQETQRVQIDGVMYDYAFDVTLGDGRSLKLAHNLSDDPQASAQRFCEKHELPISCVATFTNFLRSQLGLSTTTPSNTNAQFADPFTGGGRYVPGQSSSSAGQFADPFTGGGRYVPGNSTSSSASATSGDPFTSGGRYVPGSGSNDLIPNSCLPRDPLKPRGPNVPISAYYTFTNENPSQKAIAKLREINDLQETYKLNSQQLSALERIWNLTPNAFEVSEVEISALETCLSWQDHELTVSLDLFRVGLLNPYLNQHFCEAADHAQQTRDRLIALLVSSPTENVRLCACRALANAFSHASGRKMLMQEIRMVVEVIMCQFSTCSKEGTQIAAASVLANLSYLFLNRSEKVSEIGPREDLLRFIVKELEQKGFGIGSQTALMRLLQAIVTAMWGDKTVTQLAKKKNLTELIARIKDAVTDEPAKHIARDIVEMIYAV